ncbi:MAG TPA: PQQ-binding-like beta-propeller repeat protein [Phycisphaerales bacterium]|nr:PQQ-binding-like beta-propeller repeat protein [Phycisphaerales bacterium]
MFRGHLVQGIVLTVGACALGLAPALGAPPGMGMAQQANPVYVDDSPAAADTIVRVREHVSAGNLDEAVRIVQAMLDEQPDRLLASAKDPDLFVNVRSGMNEVLLGAPALLERYRATFGPRADRLLGEGHIERVERSLLLTPSGFDATVRLAQAAIEDARFEHARLLLEQLDKHPDRKDERARRAAAVMARLARLLDRAEVREMATRWTREAGASAPDLTPVAWPAAARATAMTPMSPTGPTATQGIVSKPLWTVAMTPGAAPPEPNLGQGRSPIALPLYGHELLSVPSVFGDMVFVSDGTQIGAWDRFTLTPRWTIAPGIDDGSQMDPGIRGDRRRIDRLQFGGYPARNDDLCTLAVSGRLVVGATGRLGSGSRGDGDDHVVALDAATGRKRWSVQLNVLDPPALFEATVRGPVQIVEGTVVFAARKTLTDRRLVSISLVGLDLPTGKLRWVRQIGSAGSMPWVLQSMGADGAAVSDGVVYRADRLGVVGAVEAGTGRARWVRRMPVDTSNNTDQPLSWQLGCPIVDETSGGAGSIIIITPDMRRIVRLDRATGAILASRDVTDMAASPKYLLRIGDRLACVGDDRVAFLTLANFQADKPVLTATLPPPGIRGRCVVAGDRLLCPMTTGFNLVDPAHPADVQTVALEDSGNILPLDSQLVVVDDARLHSYLQWDVAEGLLTKRIEADPKDPTPAVTYVELAYRAGKPERIVHAVRQAMSALKLGPQNDSTWSARVRLIDALQGMLATALEPATGSAGSAAGRPPLLAQPITDRATLADLVTLLGEVSFEPQDKLAHILAMGRLAELNDKPADAVRAYQNVLLEPALAGATWRGPQVSIRGELEATRRIESLLMQHGPSIYAAQEQQAQSELAALGAGATEPQLESLAAKYPLAQQTPGVWMRLADMRQAAKKPQQASSALEAGLRSAMRQPSPPEAVVGEIAGRLIVGLRERGQLAAAAGVLRSVRQRFASVALTSAGQALDAEKLGAEIAERIAASTRWPRIGAVRQENGQSIAGWTILEPLLTDRTPNVTSLLPLTNDEEVGIWTIPTTGHEGKGEWLTKAWSSKLPDSGRALLIRATSDAAYFAIVKESDATVMKVGGSPLETRWKSDALSKVFNSADVRRGVRNVPGARGGFPTPAEGEAQSTNFIVTMDDRTLVLVQRGGTAAAFDTDTGELLWCNRVGVGRVYDADLSSGTLAVAGDQEIYGPGGTVIDLRPIIQIVDARTGRSAQRITDLAGHVRWVGFADPSAGGAPAGSGGTLIAALDASVVSLDLATAQANWTISNADAMPVSSMWIFGDQLVMADQGRNIWLATVSTGRLRPSALEVPRSHLDLSQTLDAFPISAAMGSGFGVATQQGLALFDSSGTLTGVDGMDGSSAMIRPLPAEGRAVTIETIADGRTSDGMMMFTMHALDIGGKTGASLLDSRPVLLGARPTTMALLDDRVAISAGSYTVVLHAPAQAK